MPRMLEVVGTLRRAETAKHVRIESETGVRIVQGENLMVIGVEIEMMVEEGMKSIVIVIGVMTEGGTITGEADDERIGLDRYEFFF